MNPQVAARLTQGATVGARLPSCIAPWHAKPRSRGRKERSEDTQEVISRALVD
jgi:hypothetical protein